MQRLNKKGFLLVDSLISLLILVVMSILCFAVYKAYDNYSNGYIKYQDKTKEIYEEIYEGLETCQKCQIEEGQSQLEQY